MGFCGDGLVKLEDPGSLTPRFPAAVVTRQFSGRGLNRTELSAACQTVTCSYINVVLALGVLGHVPARRSPPAHTVFRFCALLAGGDVERVHMDSG